MKFKYYLSLMVVMGEEHTARHGLTEDVSDAVKSGASVGLSTHHTRVETEAK